MVISLIKIRLSWDRLIFQNNNVVVVFSAKREWNISKTNNYIILKKTLCCFYWVQIIAIVAFDLGRLVWPIVALWCWFHDNYLFVFLGFQSKTIVRFPWQPWSEPNIAHFKALKFMFMWIKHRTKWISERAKIGFDHGLPCRVKNMTLWASVTTKSSASVFLYWVHRAKFFTRHGRPWSNPTWSWS